MRVPNSSTGFLAPGCLATSHQGQRGSQGAAKPPLQGSWDIQAEEKLFHDIAKFTEANC